MTAAGLDQPWSNFTPKPRDQSLDCITVRLIAAINVLNELALGDNPTSIMGKVSQEPKL
jgi:hypothetical protein